MKTLKTIQTLAKIGKILSKIVFILCLVGGIGCIVGILCLAGLSLGGVTVHGMIEISAAISMGTCYTAMAMGIIFCAGEAVLAKIAERYFKSELADGTPFTLDGAKKLMHLGICTICIPIGTIIAASITYEIMQYCFKDVADMHLNDSTSVGMGLMLIIMSLLCRYGAEIMPLKKHTDL